MPHSVSSAQTPHTVVLLGTAGMRCLVRQESFLVRQALVASELPLSHDQPGGLSTLAPIQVPELIQGFEARGLL